jgi:hypothetical protein
MKMNNSDAKKLIRSAVTDGILNAFAWLGVGVLIVTFALGWVTPYDDTDFNGNRSGLTILTDCKNGLQYLSTREGGLTPRLDETATQIRKPCK